MSKFLMRLSMVLATLFIAGGLAFGATEAFGSSMVTDCNNPSQGLIGTCPGDFANDMECNQGCLAMFGNPGMCSHGCCMCTL